MPALVSVRENSTFGDKFPPVHIEQGNMDQSAVSYFVQKFGAYDTDELGDLVSRRSGLSDEAVEALNHVLSAKGLKESDVLFAPQPAPLRTPEEEENTVETQTKGFRDLWRGGLSTTCKFLVALILIAPVQNFLKSASLGALWAGLLVLVAGYTGYKLGHIFTKKICSNADIPLQAKRKNLWIMFALLWPIYFVVYVASQAVFARG